MDTSGWHKLGTCKHNSSISIDNLDNYEEIWLETTLYGGAAVGNCFGSFPVISLNDGHVVSLYNTNVTNNGSFSTAIAVKRQENNIIINTVTTVGWAVTENDYFTVYGKM